jgi:hypothetical protein
MLLPSEGRQGPTPPWPLPPSIKIDALNLAEIELEVWAEAWATPQAVAWERLGWTRDVAQYVRWKVLGEAGGLDEAKEARQWSDRLGLSPLALLRLNWSVVQDELAEQRETSKPDETSPKRRLKVAGAVARS